MGRFWGCASVVLVLASSMLLAQQPAGGSQPQTSHTNVAAKRLVRSNSRSHAKANPAPAQIPVQVVTGGEVRTQMFDAWPAGSAKTQPAGSPQKRPGRTTVEEINGGQKSTRVFAAEEQNEAGVNKSRSRSKRTTKTAKTGPATETVEVFNGKTSYTTTFRQAPGGKESEELANQRVVTGIESGRMRAGVKKSQPVVIGVSSNEQDNASAKPVVVAVASSGVESNRPVEEAAHKVQRHSKRRPYAPNPPSR